MRHIKAMFLVSGVPVVIGLVIFTVADGSVVIMSRILRKSLESMLTKIVKI